MLASVAKTPILPGLSPVGGMLIEARFDPDLLSSIRGVAGITRHWAAARHRKSFAACIDDPSARGRVAHGLDEIIRFHMRMIAASTRMATKRTGYAAIKYLSSRWSARRRRGSCARRRRSRSAKGRCSTTANRPLFAVSMRLLLLPADPRAPADGDAAPCVSKPSAIASAARISA